MNTIKVLCTTVEIAILTVLLHTYGTWAYVGGAVLIFLGFAQGIINYKE